jgi:hypothetical protein
VSIQGVTGAAPSERISYVAVPPFPGGGRLITFTCCLNAASAVGNVKSIVGLGNPATNGVFWQFSSASAQELSVIVVNGGVTVSVNQAAFNLNALAGWESDATYTYMIYLSSAMGENSVLFGIQGRADVDASRPKIAWGQPVWAHVTTPGRVSLLPLQTYASVSDNDTGVAYLFASSVTANVLGGGGGARALASSMAGTVLALPAPVSITAAATPAAFLVARATGAMGVRLVSMGLACSSSVTPVLAKLYILHDMFVLPASWQSASPCLDYGTFSTSTQPSTGMLVWSGTVASPVTVPLASMNACLGKGVAYYDQLLLVVQTASETASVQFLATMSWWEPR